MTISLRSPLVLAALLAAVLLSPRHLAAAQTAPTHAVTWDSHSLLVDGKRLLLYSGEFHYWRLPSTQEWEDRLEKMKAAGLNAVSIYFDWQYHSWAPGQYDFTGVRDVDKLLDITDRLGLYVLARVGPYMNAEADAGGLPGWLLTKQVNLRAQSWNGSLVQAQDSPLYLQYSQEWLDHILPIVARHQVTRGGSVLLVQLENEYSQDEGSAQYMKSLIAIARADGIQVPIFHNDFYFKGDWSSAVDLYAFDSYPYGFSCCHQWWDLHFKGVDTWESNLRGSLKITTPMFVSELQGGSFDGWGGTGYDRVAQTLDGDWLTALDESALAQGTTALNTYMFAGGTSWGYMSEPDVYTSYDYGAPIGEAGQLRPAYYAAHRLALFLQTYGTQLAAADAAPHAATAANQAVAIHTRIDPTSGQAFIFLRHGDAGDPVQTRVHLALPQLALTIPQKPNTAITLPGHGATVLTANVQTGPLHLNYSTSQVLTLAQTAQGPYLVLFGPAGSHGETDFTAPSGTTTVSHDAGVELNRSAGQLRLNYIHTVDPRVVLLNTPAGPLHLLITTTATASRLWNTGTMLISGPNLVETDGTSDKLWTSAGENVTAYGAPTDRPIQIDGRPAAAPDPLMGAVLLGSPGGATISLPALTGWKFQAESPETDPAFDDSSWQTADKPSTNPNLQPPSTLPMDDFGFHYGFVWYRGHFTASGAETSFTIVARHSYSVYLNGTYIGSGDAPLTDPPHPYGQVTSFSLPATLLRPGRDNVIAVLTESLGHDEGWIAGPAAQSPQGILLANFGDVQTPITWRIQGAAGGETPTDITRGLLNASGLYGERAGWYLPSFDDSQWSPVSLPDDWRQRGVPNAVGWYRTHFQLNLPTGADAPIGITIPHAADKAVIWVNGWLLGRYWEQKGPQHEFYLPAGLLHTNGDNTVAIAIWNRGHDGGLDSVPALATYQQDQEHDVTLGAPTQPAAGYWHTSGNRIVDNNNRPVRIAAVNWFGMENSFYVPAGLDTQPLQAIVDRVRDLGFNAIRLSFSNELVETNPIIQYRVDANPDLKGLHALDVMDRIVAAARRDGLRIILDDQRSSAGTQPQRNGLWYTKRYPESAWIDDWERLVERYKDDPTVVGVDLRNEPHTGPPGPWTVKAYLHQGSTWGPYNGVDDPARDWRLAAERGGDAVLKLNPHLLIFVEGLQLYPDHTQPNGIDSYWWGGILTPARQYPVELSVPHQLVYSPHEYGPLKWQMPWFGPHMTYASMERIWTKHWEFLEQQSFAEQAPIFLGEFGTCGDTVKCVKDPTPGSQGLWFSYLMRFMREHPGIGWAYWALNGSNHVGAPTPQYVLRPNWKDVRLPALLQTLRDIEVAPGP